MRALAIVLAASSAMALLISSPDPALSFKCQSGTIGQGTCTCSGTSDCTDMRHSKMCKSDLDCSQGSCKCTAALVANPGGGDAKPPKATLPKAPPTAGVKQY